MLRAAALAVFVLGLVTGGLMLATVNVVFVVATDSMSPAIDAGDLIVTRPFKGPVAAGSIVTFSWEGQLITHRVQQVLAGGLRTKGDKNALPDDWIVPLSAVHRVYHYRIRHLGRLLGFLQTPLGWVAAVIVPALIVVFDQMLSLSREARRPAALEQERRV